MSQCHSVQIWICVYGVLYTLDLWATEEIRQGKVGQYSILILILILI